MIFGTKYKLKLICQYYWLVLHTEIEISIHCAFGIVGWVFHINKAKFAT